MPRCGSCSNPAVAAPSIALPRQSMRTAASEERKPCSSVIALHQEKSRLSTGYPHPPFRFASIAWSQRLHLINVLARYRECPSCQNYDDGVRIVVAVDIAIIPFDAQSARVNCQGSSSTKTLTTYLVRSGTKRARHCFPSNPGKSGPEHASGPVALVSDSS